MSTSGYYDEIAKVEALRRQRLWRFRRKHPDSVTERTKQSLQPAEAAANALRKR